MILYLMEFTDFNDAGFITDYVFDDISSYYVMNTKFDIANCIFTNINKGAIISSIGNIVIENIYYKCQYSYTSIM